MIAIKAIELRDKFKEICDMVAEGETVIVSRPHRKNVVVLSEKEYNAMVKAKKNAEYLAMLDQSEREIAEGKVIYKTIEELEEMAK